MNFIFAKVTTPQAKVRGDIFAGEFGGYGFDWISAEARLNKREISHFALTLQRGTGEGSLTGRLVLPRGGYAGFLSAEGSVVKGQIEHWLPFRDLREQTKGIFDADVKIQGSLRAPEVTADIHMLRPQVAGLQFDTAEGKLSYEKGILSIPSFVAQVDGSKLTASGKLPSAGGFDFNFGAEGLRLASLMQAFNSSASVDGRLFMEGHLTGSQAAPQLAVHLRAEDASLGGLRAGNLESDLQWNSNGLEISNFDFALQGGHLRLAGGLAKAIPSEEDDLSSWRSNLKVNADGLPIGLLFDLLHKSISGPMQAALGKFPRPLQGFLTGSAGLVGPLDSPIVEAGFVISDAGLAGQRLPYIDAKMGYEEHKLLVHSFTASEGEANANASGVIDFAGETELDVDIHNLQAETLRPWLPWLTGLGGLADSYLRVTGPTASPSIRGDMEIAKPVLGNFELDTFKIDSFTFADEKLDIENIRLVKGANRLRVSASLPFSWRAQKLKGDGPIWAEAVIEKQDLSLISVFQPNLGALSGPFEADLIIGGTADRPLLDGGFMRAEGTWKGKELGARFSINSEVKDHLLQIAKPDGSPGINLSLEKNAEDKPVSQGSVQITGSYDPFAGPKSRWGIGKYDIAVKAEKLEGNIAKLISGIANVNLTLRGDPEGEPTDKISGAVQVANAKLTLPRKGVAGSFTWRPRFHPQLDIAVTAADVHVSTATAQVALAGKGKIGGHLGYEPLAIDMKMNTKKGKLDFPAAAAEIKSLDITVSKAPEEPLNIFGQVEAQARVGRYRMNLSGSGTLFPTSNLVINTTSTPSLTDTQAMALLLGVPPSTLGTAGLPPEQALGTEVANRLSNPFAALAATGVSAPLLRAIGLDELSIGISSVAIGKRFGDRLYIYYVSPLSGAATTAGTANASPTGLTRVIFDLTSQISVGFSVNELQQWRYEVQSIRLF